MGRRRKKRKYTKRKLIDGNSAVPGRTLVVDASEWREVIEMARTTARRMEDILFQAAERG